MNKKINNYVYRVRWPGGEQIIEKTDSLINLLDHLYAHGIWQITITLKTRV